MGWIGIFAIARDAWNSFLINQNSTSEGSMEACKIEGCKIITVVACGLQWVISLVHRQ